MATTPPTSISSSYQRIGGSTPVITQGTPGPQLSAATQERLRLAEQRKLEEERALAEQRKRASELKSQIGAYYKSEAEKMKNMSPFQIGQYQAQKAASDIQRQKEYMRGQITGSGGRPNF